MLSWGHCDPRSYCDNFTSYKNKAKYFLFTIGLCQIPHIAKVKRNSFLFVFVWVNTTMVCCEPLGHVIQRQPQGLTFTCIPSLKAWVLRKNEYLTLVLCCGSSCSPWRLATSTNTDAPGSNFNYQERKKSVHPVCHHRCLLAVWEIKTDVPTWPFFWSFCRTLLQFLFASALRTALGYKVLTGLYSMRPYTTGTLLNEEFLPAVACQKSITLFEWWRSQR